MFEQFGKIKCSRLPWHSRLDWTGDGKTDWLDAMAIGEFLWLLPIRLLLMIIDFLSPVAKALGLNCHSGQSIEWVAGSGLLWLLIIGAIVQAAGWRR